MQRHRSCVGRAIERSSSTYPQLVDQQEHERHTSAIRIVCMSDANRYCTGYRGAAGAETSSTGPALTSYTSKRVNIEQETFDGQT